MSAPPVLEVRDLVNGFGSELVHDHLSLTIREGEIFSIVGASGTGKSVLLRSILGLERPRGGQILIRGRDLTQMSAAELYEVKAGYGVTFQQGALFSSLNVLQNIQLPMIEHLRLPARVLDGLARFKLQLVGLSPDAAEKYPSQLSGGMVKRAALARALALDPGLLFLDEPTSGLDPISAAAFDELLMYLQHELRLTVVMITHDLDSIYRVSNRVGVLVDKHMVSGTLEEMAAYDHPWIHAYFQGERARHRGRPNGEGS